MTIGTVNLKRKSNVHILRKLWHFLGVLLIAYAYNHIEWKTMMIGWGILWVLTVPLDFIRLFHDDLNSWFIGFFQKLMRRTEIRKMTGNSYLLTGVGMIMLVFPPEVVTLSLLMLAFGDPVASFVGVRWGKTPFWPPKTLEGSGSAFVICSLVAFFFLLSNNLLIGKEWFVALLMGLSASVAEVIPVGKLDDNFTIPVFSSIFIAAIFWMFGVSLWNPI